MDFVVSTHIYSCTGTGIYNVPHVHTLNIVAYLHTAHTLDTFSCITD